jgi:hypothetical protein
MAQFNSFSDTPSTPSVQHEVTGGNKHVEKLVERLSDSQQSHQLNGESNLADILDGRQLV